MFLLVLTIMGWKGEEVKDKAVQEPERNSQITQ